MFFAGRELSSVVFTCLRSMPNAGATKRNSRKRLEGLSHGYAFFNDNIFASLSTLVVVVVLKASVMADAQSFYKDDMSW